MKPCDEFEPRIEQMVSGEISSAERDLILRHCRECAHCSGVVALHEELSAVGAARETGESPEVLSALAHIRSSVLRELQAREEQYPARRPRHRSLFNLLFGRPVPAFGVALSMLLLGLGIGYWSFGRIDLNRQIMRQLERDARDAHGLSQVEASPYIYSNVSFRPLDVERVAMSFDFTAHVDLTTEKNDPVVREMLMQSLINPSSVGTRLRAISFAGEVMGTEVKQVLLFSMLNDSNVAVRLKALALLSPHRRDPDIQKSLLQVLRTDESVQMRLTAMDYLVDTQVSPELLRETMRSLETKEQNTAVLAKAEAYLR